MMRFVIVSLAAVALIGSLAEGQADGSVPTAPPPAASGNSTGKSLFVLEALLATFTKDSVGSNTGTLFLQSVSPKTTWFSEAPLQMSGHIKTSHVAGPHFYKSKGQPSTWLNNANAAMYASKNNATTKSSPVVFTMNSAPVMSADGTSWNINATYIPSNVNSAFVYKGPQSFQAKPQDSSLIGAMVTTFAPVALFIDDICYLYYVDGYGYIYVSDFYYC